MHGRTGLEKADLEKTGLEKADLERMEREKRTEKQEGVEVKGNKK